MKYIYLLTFPNKKYYIGKSDLPIEEKKKTFLYSKTKTRIVVNAIKKYRWDTIKFDIIESSNEWTNNIHNEKENANRWIVERFDK